MKKRMSIFITGLLLCVSSFAQGHNFQIKAGINTTSIHIYESSTGFNPCYQVGAYYDYHFYQFLFLEPGIELCGNFLSNSSEGFSNPPYYSKDKLGINFKVPIHIGINKDLLKSLKVILQTGPHISYRVGGGTQKEKEFKWIEDIRKPFDFGAGIIAGLEFQKFNLYLGYDYGFLNVSRIERKFHNQSIYLIAGFYL